MKAISVAVKSIKENTRDWMSMGLAIALPGSIMVIFGLVFARPPDTVKLFLDNQDTGAAGAALVETLKAEKFPDGRPKLELVPEKADHAMELVKSREAPGYIKIPAGYTDRVVNGTLTAENQLEIGGDPSQEKYSLSFLYVQEAVSKATEKATGKKPPNTLQAEWIGLSANMTQFDTMAPGFLVFAVMLLAIQVAMVVVVEVEKGTLQRLRLTAMSSADLFAGITISMMVIAAVQVPLIFLVAKLLGYHNNGSLWFGMVLCIALALSAVGFGLFTSCFVKTPMLAANVGASVAMPIVFMSGALFPVPPMTVAEIGGRKIDLMDSLPAKHVMDALVSTLTYGKPWTECMYQLVMTLVLSFMYLVMGAVIFQFLKMRTAY